MHKFKSIFCLFTILIAIVYSSIACGENNAKIIIDCSSTKYINPMIFGHNALGFRYLFSANKRPRDYSIYGAGQWDISTREPNGELVRLAKEIKMSVLRFPGGGGAHKYKWKDTIGLLENRPFFKFGMDEFLTLCDVIGAEPMLTISYFTNTDEDISDLIEYLNTVNEEKNREGKYKWARSRARNKHPEPYGVKFFELGNEVYWPRRTWKGRVSAREYASRYLKVRSMLKSIDKSIQLGAILHDAEWNDEVTTALKDSMDFGILHMYPCDYNSNEGEMTPNELFKIALAGPNQYNSRIMDIGEKLKHVSGKTIPLAITEYNGRFRQEEPVPYRHSLGNALLVADLIRVFLTTDAPILCANYWQFANSYWGALYNPQYRKGNGQYFFRPNFFVFEMFAKYFGELLAESTVFCPSYTSRSYRDIYKTMDNARNTYTDRSDAISHVINPEDWIVREQPGVRVSKISNEIRICFDNYNNRNYFHTKALHLVKPDYSYQLTALVKTENLVPPAAAYLEVQDFRGWSKIKWAKRTKEVSGTRDWTKVFINFDPVDAYSKGVSILIRQYSKKGPLRGIIRVKNVILKDLGPTEQYPSTPYLSAIASIDKKRNKLYLLVINKNLTGHMSSIIRVKNFNLHPEVKIYTLNGASVDATNENGKTRVKISSKDFHIQPGATNFEFIFEPHSVTALEMSKNERM